MIKTVAIAYKLDREEEEIVLHLEDAMIRMGLVDTSKLLKPFRVGVFSRGGLGTLIGLLQTGEDAVKDLATRGTRLRGTIQKEMEEEELPGVEEASPTLEVRHE